MNDELLDWVLSIGKKHRLTADEPGPEPEPASSALVDDVHDDDFWKDLETRAVEGLRNWLNNTYGKAIETFSDDLSRTGGDEPGAIVWSVTKTVLSFVPHTSIPVAIAEVGLDLAKLLPGSTQSLEDFLYEARSAREKIGGAIYARTDPTCKELREWAKGAQKDDPAFRAKADAAIRQAIKGLPSDKKILKGMVDDWVKASEDHWDGSDMGGPEAGYIYVDVVYDQSSNRWFNRYGPHIDDVEKSTGVRKALEHSYGKNTPINQLPYPAKATFTFLVDPEHLSALELVFHTGKRLTGRGGPELKYLLRKNGAGKFSECKRSDWDEGLFPDNGQLPPGIPNDALVGKLFNAHYAKLKVKDLDDE